MGLRFGGFGEEGGRLGGYCTLGGCFGEKGWQSGLLIC